MSNEEDDYECATCYDTGSVCEECGKADCDCEDATLIDCPDCDR